MEVWIVLVASVMNLLTAVLKFVTALKNCAHKKKDLRSAKRKS